MLQPVISLLLSIAIVGFLVWVLITYVPMPEPIRRVLIAVVVIVVFIWLLRWAGLL